MGPKVEQEIRLQPADSLKSAGKNYSLKLETNMYLVGEFTFVRKYDGIYLPVVI